MSKTATKEQVTAVSNDVAIVDRTVMTVEAREARAREILNTAITQMARPEQSALEMALAVMDAKSDDDVFGSTVLHLKDMIGTPFTIDRAWLTDSEYVDGLPAYTIMEATLDDGSTAIITTGATNVVAAVINFHVRDRFPIRVDTKTDTTKSGYEVVKLIRPTTDAPTLAQQQSF